MSKTDAKQNSSGKRNWSSHSLAGKWRHKFFYRMLQLFGLWPARCCLFFVVVTYCLRPSINSRSLYYLTRRFPGASCFTNFIQTFNLYWQFAQILLERAAAGLLGKLKIENNEADKGLIEAQIKRGKGVIFLSGHVGCWQVGLAALSFGVPINLVHPRSEQDVDLHFFEHGGENNFPEIRVIDPNKFKDHNSAILSMATALIRGELLCIMGDRLIEADNIEVPVRFLGGEIRLPGSVYLLASRTGAPIVISFSYRTGVCKLRSYVWCVLEIPPNLPKLPGGIAPYAQRMADGLEDFCAKKPYQFFNFHNMWTDEREKGTDEIK